MNAGAKIAAIPRNIAQFFKEIPAKTVLFWKNRVNSVKSGYSNIRDFLSQCDWKVLLSLVFMGAGNIAYKQYAKGIIYLLLEAMFIVYMSLLGGNTWWGW